MKSLIQQLRSEMAVTAQYAYFDHAAVAPLPKATTAAIQAYAQEAGANGDALWLDWARKIEDLRLLAAQMIGAETAELALVPNTTHGIQIVAQGFGWRDGDNVVVPSNEFPSNLLPWRSLADKGVEIRELPVPQSGDIDLDALSKLIDEQTRIVTISWVGYATGFRIPVEKVAEMAHSQGSLLFLDAIQGLGAFPLNVRTMGIDFLAADGHKWLLGPEGAGLFYCRQELLDRLGPVGIGWNSLSQGAFDGQPHVLKSTAGRYEGGTMNMPGFHGLGESINLLLQSGLNSPDASPAIAHSILTNVAYAEEQLQRAGFHTCIPAHESHRSGIVGITWPEAEQEPRLYAKARLHLMDRKIVTSVRANRLRISIHAYNNREEIERLVQELQEFRRRSAN